MSDPDDYESLPATASLGVTCFAGALAGIAEHCVMFPIDSVKVGSEAERVVLYPLFVRRLRIDQSLESSNRHITHL